VSTQAEEVIKHPKNADDFNKLISGGKPALVDFFAEWCGPCQMMGPILDDMAKNFKEIDKVDIIKVDIDALSDVAQEYNVMSVPTFAIFKDGKIAETMVGMRPQEELEQKLKDVLK